MIKGTCVPPVMVGVYFVDGQRVTRVEQGQVFEAEDDIARQLIEGGQMIPLEPRLTFETPKVSYEAYTFEPTIQSHPFETKEAESLRRVIEAQREEDAADQRDLPDQEPPAVDAEPPEVLPGTDLPKPGTRNRRGRG